MKYKAISKTEIKTKAAKFIVFPSDIIVIENGILTVWNLLQTCKLKFLHGTSLKVSAIDIQRITDKLTKL